MDGNPSNKLARRSFLTLPLLLPTATACGSFSLTNALFDKKPSKGVKLGPILQNATESSMGIMFEGIGDEVRVEFGPTRALGQTEAPSEIISRGPVSIFHVTLSNLEPDSDYYYRVSIDGESTAVSSFQTPPPKGARKPFRFAVYSDCQQRPNVHRAIVDKGLLERDLALVLVVGDVVQNGNRYAEYQERFFSPIARLAAKVPYYTAIGNHEADSHYYFDYLNLPKNGSSGFEEHWYSFDYGNAHFIGLDTNGDYQLTEQLEWLNRDLEAACADSRTDFVFAYFHHPYRSELWPQGESAYAGDIVRLLEHHLGRSGKSGAYFFGHTHGYSRGQSRDVPLYWVNVGSAGGTLDRWGMYPEQRPYPEYQCSIDDYGALIIEVNGGGDAEFRGKRLSFGRSERPHRFEVSDEFGTTMRGSPPSAPEITSAIAHTNDDGLIVELAASPYVGGGQHLETEWQLVKDDHGEPVHSDWVRREKWYFDRNVGRAGELEATAIRSAARLERAQARVRYRCDLLRWSPWSPLCDIKGL